jgi:omega-6 fatty acid desaturase (delta-12 desaturase)
VQSPDRSYDARLIKSILSPFKVSSVKLALLIFGLDTGLYLLLFAYAVVGANLTLRTLASIACGFVIGLLFIVGHDACHGSFTNLSWLNRLIGTLAFVPSLHAFSLWALGHNRIHHRFTNLKPVDYVWTPFSKSEFDSLPKHRRWLERIYRTFPGHAIYYAHEIWWRKMLFPNPGEIPDSRPEYTRDSWFVIIGGLLITGSCVVAAEAFHRPVAPALFFGCLIPFIVWNWLIGFVIYLHHTHPSVTWFDNENEWEFWESQIEGSTHIRFPRVLNFIIHNILEHTAHHALTGIPLYKLKAAQDELERQLTSHIKIVDWTVSSYLTTLRRCKLYDYRTHQWQDFCGRPTTSPTVFEKKAFAAATAHTPSAAVTVSAGN